MAHVNSGGEKEYCGQVDARLTVQKAENVMVRAANIMDEWFPVERDFLRVGKNGHILRIPNQISLTD